MAPKKKSTPRSGRATRKSPAAPSGVKKAARRRAPAAARPAAVPTRVQPPRRAKERPVVRPANEAGENEEADAVDEEDEVIDAEPALVLAPIPARDPVPVAGPARAGEDGEEAGDAVDADGVPAITVLAETQTYVDVNFQGNATRLRVQLKVHLDKDDHKSRLGYRGSIALYVPDEDDFVDIGHIQAWRLNKTTAIRRGPARNRRGRGIPEPCVTELFTLDLANAGGPLFDMALCMQRLYHRNGRTRSALRRWRRNLRDHSLMYIEMIHIESDFQRKGILEPALEGFYQTLANGIPEWFAFAGTIVLIPASPQGEHGNVSLN